MTKDKNIYIIGCGSDLAGNDGVGTAVVRNLTEYTDLPRNIS